VRGAARRRSGKLLALEEYIVALTEPLCEQP
jgi:hypothetical protein